MTSKTIKTDLTSRPTKDLLSALPEVTPWFSLETPPARTGEYDYSGPGMSVCRLIWNGHHFGYYLATNWIHFADSDGDKWRGLASNPEKAKA